MSEPREAAAHLWADPALAAVVKRHGPVELEPAPDLFRRTVVSLVRQQVSTTAAAAVRERLFDAVTVTPAGVLDADPDTLREAGLSERKTEYLRALATAWRDQGYDREAFAELSDEAVVAELTEVRGIGPWTAKMVLLLLCCPNVVTTITYSSKPRGRVLSYSKVAFLSR